MSSIRITAVTVQGFKCFTSEVLFSPHLLGTGLHFIRGENKLNPRLGANGAGKSSLWDAVCWCLYGVTVGGLKTTDIRSWRSDKPLSVTVSLVEDHSEGSENIEITRAGKATGVTINGDVVGQDDVDDVIGLDYALFTQAVIMGQNRPLFFDLPPKDKMALFAEVLGLEKWEERAKHASKTATALTLALEALEGEITGLESAEEHATSALEEARSLGTQWDEERSVRLQGLQEEVKEAQDQAAVLTVHRDELNLAADGTGVEINLARTVVDGLRENYGADRDAAHDMDAEVRNADIEIERLNDSITALKETGTCPLCEQKLKAPNAKHHINKLMGERDKVTEQKNEAADHGKKAWAKADKLDQQLLKEQDRLRKLEAVEDNKRSLLTMASAELGEATTKYHTLDASLTELQEGVNPHRETVTAARTRLKEVKKDLDAICDKVDEAELELERTNFWSKGFRQIRLMLIEDVLNDLQETTAELLEEMGLGEWEIRYRAERETKTGTTQHALTVEVISPESNEDPKRWEVWSGGEGQRLRLAGALALSEVLLAHAGMEISLRVLDEPTRGLSTEGVRDLCELLAAYAENTGLQLFYVDHTAVESAHFTTVTTVVNDEDGAHLK